VAPAATVLSPGRVADLGGAGEAPRSAQTRYRSRLMIETGA